MFQILLLIGLCEENQTKLTVAKMYHKSKSTSSNFTTTYYKTLKCYAMLCYAFLFFCFSVIFLLLPQSHRKPPQTAALSCLHSSVSNSLLKLYSKDVNIGHLPLALGNPINKPCMLPIQIMKSVIHISSKTLLSSTEKSSTLTKAERCIRVHQSTLHGGSQIS